MELEKGLSELSQAIIGGKHVDSEKITSELLMDEIDAKEILERGLLPGMAVVGQRFRDGEIYLPQVLVSARAMKVAMKLLEPLLAKSNMKSRGKILLGTVKGDVHDIGKNIVGIMLQGAGYNVVDAGIDCDAHKIFVACEEQKPDIIGLSAMLTTTMVYMKTVTDYLHGKGVTAPIIIGGAPTSQKYAEGIGADGYAHNAADAVELVKRILDDRG